MHYWQALQAEQLHLPHASALANQTLRVFVQKRCGLLDLSLRLQHRHLKNHRNPEMKGPDHHMPGPPTVPTINYYCYYYIIYIYMCELYKD